MGLASRRRYRWTRGRISDYWDEVFTAEGFETHAALDDQSAFIASLGSDRSPRMRDVLGTIQADQDAIIRAGSRGALVVDGGPGTGKTVVALHRTAYLLYSDPRLGHRRGGVLFVGPHQPYLSYVSDVLPSLGEEGVQTCTLRDLVPQGAAATPESRPGGGPPEVLRGHGAGDRAGRAVLRGAADRGHGGRDAVRRPLGQPRRLGRRLRRGATRYAAQRGARPGLGGAAHHPGRARSTDDERRGRGRTRPTLGRAGPAVDRPEPGARRGLQQGVAAARGDRPRRRPVGGAGLPAAVRAVARARRRSGCSSATTRAPGPSPTCRCWTPPGSGSATRRRHAAGVGTRRPSPPSVSGWTGSSRSSSSSTTRRA